MNTGIVIASHVNYMHVALPILLNTLPRDIPHIVYIAGANEYRVNGNYVYVPYNAFEYTPLIEQASTQTYEYIHLLHDTTAVGPRYGKLLREYAALQTECVCNTSYCGMWLYQTRALTRNRDFLNTLKNCTKQDAIRHEGWFHKYKLGAAHVIQDTITCDFVERDVYHTGSKRITEYHPAFDLYKHKANYGQKGSGDFNNA